LSKSFLVWVSLFLTSSAFAEFHPVKAKFCDQKPVALENGERVFIDVSQGVIGVGAIRQNCGVYDFKMAAIVDQSPDHTKLAVVSSVGRRSTCAGNDILPYAGPEFKGAIVTQDSLELTDVVGQCSSILFKF
jgi:hypothetical protein